MTKEVLYPLQRVILKLIGPYVLTYDVPDDCGTADHADLLTPRVCPLEAHRLKLVAAVPQLLRLCCLHG